MTSFLRHILFHNFSLKLVSLIMATGLYFVATRHDDPAEVSVVVPIEFRNFPANLEISSENIPQSQIRLRGPERLVQRLLPGDVKTEVDLAGMTAGEHTFDLNAEHIEHPHGISVVQVVPTQLRVALDLRSTRQIEIRPRIIGTFANGYSVSQVIAAPAQITVSGPDTRVKRVEAAITDPIDASGTMERAVFITRAYVSDPMVQVVNPEAVRVTVIMKKDALQSQRQERRP